MKDSGKEQTVATRSIVFCFILGAAFLIQAALLFDQVLNLPYDRDEGFSLMACRLAHEGKAVYRDFFYPQMPLFPTLYGSVLGLVNFKIETARAVSAVLYGILAVSVGLFVWRRRKSGWAGAVAWALMGFNTLGFYWFCRVKTFAFCDLCLFGSFIFLSRLATHSPEKTPSILSSAFPAGLLLALAFNARLTSLPLIIVDVAWLGWFMWSRRGDLLKHLAGYFFGIALGSIPSFWAMCRDWDAYWFDNLGCLKYLRPPLTFSMWLTNKLGSFGELCFYIENPIIWLLAILGALTLAREKLRTWPVESLALLRGFWFAAIYLSIQPTWPQYWIEMISFFIVGGSLAIVRLNDYGGWKRAFLICLLAIAFFGGSYRAAGRWVYSQQSRTLFGMKHLNALKEPLKELNRKYPGPVFTGWPGYLMAAGAEPVNNFQFGGYTIMISTHLSPETSRRFNLMTISEAMREIKQGSFPIVVDGLDMPEELRRILDTYFILKGDFGGIRLYLRKSLKS